MSGGGGSALVLPLYRALLRLGRTLDATPGCKALITRQPDEIFDRRGAAVVELPRPGLAEGGADAVLLDQLELSRARRARRRLPTVVVQRPNYIPNSTHAAISTR